MEGVHPIFRSLESTNAQDTEDARIRFHEYFNSTKDPWLMNGIFDYYLQSGSLRIVDLIVGVREPHERYFFDRLSDCLINSHSPQIKLQALTLLGHVVCRHPSWLYKIMHHRLIKDLLRLLKAEKDVTTLVSALLIVIILLPTIAGLMGPHLQDLFDVFSHLASWNTKNPHKVPDNQLLHLQMGLYALFNRLYGMYPCNFLNYLRAHYSVKENHPIFHDTIKPMLDTVKIHPFLVTASKESEVLPARWKMLEANDVIMECAKFSVDTSPERSRDESFRSRAASFRARPIDYSSIFEKSQSQEEEGEKQVGGFSSNLPGHEIWSPTVYTGTTTPPEAASITHTPITQAYVSSTAAYSSQEGNSPPEAAIEATPESTPVKDLRQPVFRAANLSRSLGQSQPSSPLRKESPNPFRYPPNSSTPLPGHDQSPGSAFHQQPPSKAKDPSKLFASKLQRMHQERVLIQTEEEVASLAKARVGSSGSGYYPPGSPLRLITPSPSFVGSPHPPERSEEDKEVETTMQTNKSGSSLKRSKREEDQEEHDECTDDEHQINSDGGLRFPDSQTMAQFVGRVERLRYHSQCQPDTPIIQLATLATSSGSSPREGGDFATTIVRRAQSCPEIKKNLAQSSLAPCSTTLDETEEDQEDAENLSVNFKSAKMLKELSECGTQTEDQPMVYEHMFLSVFPPWEHIQQHSAPPDLHPAPTFQEQMFSPRTALESYVASMLRSSNEKRTKPDEIKSLRDQVELLMHQLQFERHRREVHAERNRRLLGKSRANRALEEHNSALRDQINLMHRDIESYHAEIEKCKIGAGQRCDNLQHEVNYWKDQSNAVQRRLKETETENALLRKELEENKKQFSSLAKKYALAQSQISDMNNTVQDTRLAASSSSELKGEIAMLQHHLISAGELEMRLRSSLNTLNLNCHKDMEAILGNMAYSHALSGLKAEMKTRTSAFQALTAKTQEMEKGFLRREELLRLENKKLADKVEEESRGKLKETEQELKELKLVVSSKEEDLLEKTSTIQKLEKELEKLRASKSKENKPAVELEKSMSLEAVNPSSSDHLAVTAGGAKLQNLQNLVQSYEDSHGSQ